MFYHSPRFQEMSKVDSMCLCIPIEPIALVHVQEAPLFLRAPDIHTGYRVYLHHWDIFKTLCILSNEWMNVWTHLGGFLFCLLWFGWDTVNFFPVKGTWTDFNIFLSYMFCVQVCLICSAGFHLFNCHSTATYQKWLKLDYLGISVGILGCYFPGIYFAFTCFENLRNLYLVVAGVLFVYSLMMQSHPDFSSTPWKRRRTFTYSLVLGFGIIPCIHWAILHSDATGEELSVFLPRVGIAYLLIFIGFSFYASHFPECCVPGRVDIFGASHQWWHIFVLLGFCWWYYSCKSLFEHRLDVPCPTYSTNQLPILYNPA